MKRMLGLGGVAVSLACLALLASPSRAQDDKKHGYGGGQHKDGAGTGGQPGEAEMAKMMEECMKAGMPGEHHVHMEALVGDWNITGKFKMTPDAPWTESKSTCHAEWVLGNRFIMQRIKGEPMPGMPMAFEGIGFLGYDNMTKKHISSWLDNMGTMIMGGEGECSDAGKTITFMSKYLDPMTKKDSWMKSVYRIESPDRYVLQMYGPGPDGKEFMSMELTQVRKAG